MLFMVSHVSCRHVHLLLLSLSAAHSAINRRARVVPQRPGSRKLSVFLCLLKFIGEKARLYRMTANALVEATVRSKNQMFTISNTPPRRFPIPVNSCCLQMGPSEKTSARYVRNLAVATKPKCSSEIQIPVPRNSKAVFGIAIAV